MVTQPVQSEAEEDARQSDQTTPFGTLGSPRHSRLRPRGVSGFRRVGGRISLQCSEEPRGRRGREPCTTAPDETGLLGHAP